MTNLLVSSTLLFLLLFFLKLLLVDPRQFLLFNSLLLGQSKDNRSEEVLEWDFVGECFRVCLEENVGQGDRVDLDLIRRFKSLGSTNSLLSLALSDDGSLFDIDQVCEEGSHLFLRL